MLALAIAFLSFSAPITAAIATRERKKPEEKPKDGNGFSTRELSAMATDLKNVIGTVGRIEGEVTAIWKHLRPV